MRYWIGGLVARVFTLLMFRSVEVEGSPAHDGPRLIVANHFGGLVDAIVVVRAIGGLPNIVAKSTLFKTWPLRIALRILGVVPVYRRSDHADLSKNISSFDEVAAALQKGHSVLIFPEGTVTDTQELQQVKTGAARMATRAIEVGTTDLEIVPLGITYESKVSTRSRVLVEVGTHITEADINRLAEGTEIAEDNHRLVRHLTDEIRDQLTDVAPEYGSLVRERSMMQAASVHLRTSMTKPFDDPPMSSLRDVAQRLARSPEGRDTDTFTQTGRYQLALAGCGLEDHQVQPQPGTRDLAGLLLRKTLIVLLLAPLAFVGLLTNLLAILAVIGVGALVKEPVSKGTARVVTGLVMFPLMWVVQILIADTAYWFVTLVLEIVGLVFLVLLVSQVIDLFEALTDWWAVRTNVALLPDIGDLRTHAEAELTSILGRLPASAEDELPPEERTNAS